MFSLSNIAYFLSIFFCIGLSVLVFSRNKKPSGRLFLGLIISALFWIISNFLANNARNESWALLWVQLAIVGPAFISPFFLNFAIVFPNEDSKFSWTKFIITLLPSFVYIPLIFTKINVESVELSENLSLTFIPGVLYYFLFVHLLIYIPAGLIIFRRKYRYVNALGRTQISYIAVGFLFSCLIAVITALILPLVGYTQLGILGPLSSLVFVFATTYTLIKHRLFGIRFVIGRTIYILTIAALPYFTFYLIGFIYTQLFDSIFHPNTLIIGVFVALGFVYLLLYLNTKVQSLVNKNFLDPGQLFSQSRQTLTQDLQSILNIETVLKKIISAYQNAFQLEGAGVVILSTEETRNLNSSYALDLTLPPSDSLKYIGDIMTKNKLDIVITEELENMQHKTQEMLVLYQKLRESQLSLCFLLQINKKFDALIFFSKKITDSAFTTEDINFLTSNKYSITIAIDRSLLYEEVDKFNETLKKEIENATAEIKTKNEELSDSLRKEQDMMHILGHELRTPLTITQNAILMMDMRAKANTLTPEHMGEMMDKAKEGIRRETKLLDTILSSTRIENSRLVLNYEKVEANDVVLDSIEGNYKAAQEKKLNLFSHLPEQKIYCYSDRSATQQILDNLVSNAVKYTYAGHVEVRVEEDRDMIKFSVKDTGEGIPPEEIKNLGKKFYRINSKRCFMSQSKTAFATFNYDSINLLY